MENNEKKKYIIAAIIAIIGIMLGVVGLISLSNTVLIICIMWGILTAILIIKTFKKEDKELIPEFNEIYFRDINNEYSQAVVGYLVNNKAVELSDFKATILDLIRREYITYIKEENMLILEDANKVSDKLSSNESYLIDILFNKMGNGEKVSLKQMSDYSLLLHSEEFRKDFYQWIHLVREEVKSHSLYEDKKMNIEKKLIIGIPIIIAIPMIIIFKLPYILISEEVERSMLYLSFVVLLNLITMTYMATVDKKTRKGIECYTKWKALKRYISDFAVMNEKEINQIKIWDRYLVYAMTFGLTKEIYDIFDIGLVSYDKDGNKHVYK